MSYTTFCDRHKVINMTPNCFYLQYIYYFTLYDYIWMILKTYIFCRKITLIWPLNGERDVAFTLVFFFDLWLINISCWLKNYALFLHVGAFTNNFLASSSRYTYKIKTNTPCSRGHIVTGLSQPFPFVVVWYDTRKPHGAILCSEVFVVLFLELTPLEIVHDPRRYWGNTCART